MKKFLYNGKVWNLAGYHKDGDVLLWREDFEGHSGVYCWWVRSEDVKPYIEMEENE